MNADDLNFLANIKKFQFNQIHLFLNDNNCKVMAFFRSNPPEVY